MQLQLVVNMETATIEQLHRLQQQQLKTIDKLPALRRLSRDTGNSKACAYKEFRFPPPFPGKIRKDKKRKKLPPIPENMLPKRHNSLEEVDLQEYVPLPSISPTMVSDKDERSQSEAAKPSLEHPALFNVREFTFPISSASKNDEKKPSPVLSSPRLKELPIHIKIGKLARKKRKEKAMKERAERVSRHDRGYQPVNDFSFPAREKINAFKAKREPRETNSNFYLKENKQLPFKQMSKSSEDTQTEKQKLHPRLYTRIVDSIYSYSRGKLHETDSSTNSTTRSRRHNSHERLMVTPVTARDEIKEEYNRHLFLPPLS